MNVVFRLPARSSRSAFVSEATVQGSIGLAGHRSAGGIRASIYNAVSYETVTFLVDFMKDFAKRA